jgi:DNA polymerase-3 subunit gamma/tau
VTDDDDCKRTILSRRARFIAAALASAGLTAASCNKSNVEANPQPCLSAPPMDYHAAPPRPETPPPEPPPQVCLSPMPPPEDAGAPQPPGSGKVPS